jgi:hypothetical protein
VTSCRNLIRVDVMNESPKLMCGTGSAGEQRPLVSYAAASMVSVDFVCRNDHSA